MKFFISGPNSPNTPSYGPLQFFRFNRFSLTQAHWRIDASIDAALTQALTHWRSIDAALTQHWRSIDAPLKQLGITFKSFSAFTKPFIKQNKHLLVTFVDSHWTSDTLHWPRGDIRARQRAPKQRTIIPIFAFCYAIWKWHLSLPHW